MGKSKLRPERKPEERRQPSLAAATQASTESPAVEKIIVEAITRRLRARRGRTGLIMVVARPQGSGLVDRPPKLGEIWVGVRVLLHIVFGRMPRQRRWSLMAFRDRLTLSYLSRLPQGR